MITVYIPDNNIQERTYVINVIFTDFLGLPFSISIYNEINYKIVLPNNNVIIIEDHFFNKYSTPLSYLSQDSIPSELETFICKFCPESEIPVIFGKSKFEKHKREIFCGVDIFASCFFMLTRWEEYVLNSKDQYNRFSEIESLAFQYDFYKRPIVNEYIEMLWNIMKSVGFSGDRKKKTFKVIPTHDIDRIYSNTLPELLVTLYKSRNLKRSVTSLYYGLMKINQLNTFKYILDMSEQNNLTSHFYLLSGGSYEFERYYQLSDPIMIQIVSMIKNRNHIIGFHPSFYSYNDNMKWSEEKKNLENELKSTVNEGRQHYLCYENPETWQICENNNMKIDSTMGFSKHIGFRCGTGDEFHLFNIINSNAINLTERPLIIMDSALTRKNQHVNEISEILKCKELCRMYKMPFTLLFHNHQFDEVPWNGTRELYQELLH